MALAIRYAEKLEIVADRLAGMDYKAIGEKHHISHTTAREVCKAMGLKTGKIRRMEYDPRKTQRDFEQP